MLGAQTLPLLMLYHLPNPPCWICLSEIHCLIRTAKDITDNNINIWVWPCVGLFRMICYIVNCWYPFKKLTQESSPLSLETKVYFWTSFDVGLIWNYTCWVRFLRVRSSLLLPLLKKYSTSKQTKNLQQKMHTKSMFFSIPVHFLMQMRKHPFLDGIFGRGLTWDSTFMLANATQAETVTVKKEVGFSRIFQYYSDRQTSAGLVTGSCWDNHTSQSSHITVYL